MVLFSDQNFSVCKQLLLELPNSFLIDSADHRGDPTIYSGTDIVYTSASPLYN